MSSVVWLSQVAETRPVHVVVARPSDSPYPAARTEQYFHSGCSADDNVIAGVTLAKRICADHCRLKALCGLDYNRLIILVNPHNIERRKHGECGNHTIFGKP